MGSSVIRKLLLGQDKVLTNIALGYASPILIGNEIFPLISVDEEYLTIPDYAKDHLRIYDAERAVRGETRMIKPSDLGQTDITLAEWALKTPIGYREAAAGKKYAKLQIYRTKTVTQSLLIAREKRVADMVQLASNYDPSNQVTLAGASQWSDTVNSTPVADIRTGRAAVKSDMGLYPNVAIFGDEAWNTFIDHPDVIAAIYGANNFGILTEDQVATKFGYTKVIVGRSFYNIEATAVNADLWGDNVVMAYVPQSPTERADIYTPMFGASFQHNMTPPLVQSYYQDESKKVELIEATLLGNEALLMPDAGYLISDVTL